MNTYKAYLSYEKAITIEQMEEIHSEIVEEVESDPDSLELYEDFVRLSK